MTYSQLDLGENYRSYNNRQSNPNIRCENIGLCAASENVSSSSNWDRRYSESNVPRKTWAATKSAPATPRDTSPKRSRKTTHSPGIGVNQLSQKGTHLCLIGRSILIFYCEVPKP